MASCVFDAYCLWVSIIINILKLSYKLAILNFNAMTAHTENVIYQHYVSDQINSS